MGTASQPVHIGLGSNEGDRAASIRDALDALDAEGIRVVAISRLFETEPVGEITDQPEFLNAVARVATELEPLALLDRLKLVERRLGRRSGGPRGGRRPIDLDLLLMGPRTFEHERLVLPHPELTSRRFVLIPLLDVEPEAEIPGAGPAAALLAALPEAGQRVVLAGELGRRGQAAESGRGAGGVNEPPSRL